MIFIIIGFYWQQNKYYTITRNGGVAADVVQVRDYF